jgi:hypothetical protein
LVAVARLWRACEAEIPSVVECWLGCGEGQPPWSYQFPAVAWLELMLKEGLKGRKQWEAAKGGN